jgi:site-specific recombinase XerD
VVATAPHTEFEDFAFSLRYPAKGRAKGDNTIRAYLYTVDRFLTTLNGGSLDLDAARGFVRLLEESGNAPRSIGRHIYALRAYFEFKGLELGLGAPAYEKRVPRWLNDAEWLKLLQATERPLWDPLLPDFARHRALFLRAAVMVFGGAGLRLAAGSALQREDVDARGFLRYLGKGGTWKLAPAEDAVIVALDEWTVTHESPWVFPGRDGHMSSRGMHQAIANLMKHAGIANVSRPVHMLRHTMGADLRKRGADIRDIQEALGHANISTTQIYTQMATDDLAKKLPKRFSSRQRRMDLDV